MSLRSRMATTSIQDAQAAADNAAFEHDRALRTLAEAKAEAAREELQSALADLQTVLRSTHTREDLLAPYDRVAAASGEYAVAFLDLEGCRPVRIEVRR